MTGIIRGRRGFRAAVLSVAVLAVALVATPVFANMVGDDVLSEHHFPTLGAPLAYYGSDWVTVVEGTSDIDHNVYYTVNVEAESIEIDYLLSATWSSAAHNGPVISDIDAEICGITADSNLPGWDASRASFTAHSVIINWESLPFNPSNYVNIDIEFCSENKADILQDSGVPGKGIENAPGLQKEFNPKSNAAENAGKKK